jgi:hypothetical protein
MDELKNYTERHNRRTVKIEGTRVIIERTEQWERLFRENETDGGVESGNYASVSLICDCCSLEVAVDDCVHLRNFVLHRKCAEEFVEEILDQSVDKPGSIDADTEFHARMLHKQLRRERSGRILNWLLGMFQRRLPRAGR